ncbi:MAG: hypothetical protein E7676_03495 [Ruminococcaceae bacterium]|nr:hypothetical protein [Oscillospiraceae bacterium]
MDFSAPSSIISAIIMLIISVLTSAFITKMKQWQRVKDFFWYKGRPGMFFAVELGAVLSALILAFLFRKEKAKIPKNAERTRVTDFVPSVLLLGTYRE